MKKLSLGALAFTLVLTGIWTALSLYRWEWTRALWMTMLFVVAEVALVGVLVMQRLRTLEEQIEDSRRGRGRAPSRRGHPGHRPFRVAEGVDQPHQRVRHRAPRWWGARVRHPVGDRQGRGAVGGSSHERRLAAQLRAIAFPASGFVPPDSVLFAADLDRDEREDLALLLLGRTEMPR